MTPGDSPAWEAPLLSLTDRAGFPSAPNILACGIGPTPPEVIKTITARPQSSGWVADPDTPLGEAASRYTAFVQQSIVALGTGPCHGKPGRRHGFTGWFPSGGRFHLSGYQKKPAARRPQPTRGGNVVPDPKGNLLPVYVLADESYSLLDYAQELNDGLVSLYEALRAEPMIAAKVRLSILGFSDDVEVRLALADLRDVENLPEPAGSGTIPTIRPSSRTC